MADSHSTLEGALPKQSLAIPVGTRFGRWTVIGGPVRGKKNVRYLCHCNCGTEKLVYGGNLKTGQSTQCLRCSNSKKNHKHGHAGGGHSPEYRVWKVMLSRCFNPKKPEYTRYGGRGITVCERWRESFATFFEDMGPRPSDKHQIDRIDNDGNYEPENCRWTTARQQARNRRSNLLVTAFGKTQCLAAWAEEVGINYDTIRWRLKRGWPVEKALAAP